MFYVVLSHKFGLCPLLNSVPNISNFTSSYKVDIVPIYLEQQNILTFLYSNVFIFII